MSTLIRFTEEDLAAIDAALAQLEQRLTPLVALDARDRRRLFKMGAKSEAFCRQALTVLSQNRRVAPPALDLDQALAALATIDQLRPRAKQIFALATRMKDSEQLLGAHVARAARQGYKVLDEYGATHGLEGMKQALSKRFSRRPRRQEQELDEDQVA